MKRLMTTWDDKLLQNPHEVADKRTRVQKMFAAIAPSYDINNRLHSLWQDQRWRKKAVKLAEVTVGDVVVDVACGAGGLSLAFAEQLFRVSDGPGIVQLPVGARVVGIDFTFEMLPRAERKRRATPFFSNHRISDPPPQFGEVIRYINGDALSLPLPDECCD